MWKITLVKCGSMVITIAEYSLLVLQWKKKKNWIELNAPKLLKCCKIIKNLILLQIAKKKIQKLCFPAFARVREPQSALSLLPEHVCF